MNIRTDRRRGRLVSLLSGEAMRNGTAVSTTTTSASVPWFRRGQSAV